MVIPKFIIDQNIINDEIRVLDNILSQQRQLKQTLLLYLEKISDGIYNATDEQDSTSLVSCLNGIQKSFENIKSNINKILELKKYLEDSSKLDSYDSSYFEKYNDEYMKLFEKISEDNIFYYTFMESLLKYMNVAFPDTNKIIEPLDEVSSNIENHSPINTTDTLKESENVENTNTDNFKNEIYIENKNLENSSNELTETQVLENDDDGLIEKTLFISEKTNNVILPYSTADLEEYFSSNPEKYSSIQDIIDKEYTIPLNNFRKPSFSRFREAYNLARNKSKLSFFKSLSLANEVFFNYNLDPTIITACKNVDELEIYLSCLEDNALDKFKCFKIVYDLI